VVDLSPAKILVVLVVALVVLGPDKLPRVARQAGRLVSDFRKFRDGLNAEVREALGDPAGLSNLPNLSSLSNLPARGRAWVTSVATGAPPSTTAPGSAPPVSPGPAGTPSRTASSSPPPGPVSSAGPPPAGGISPGQPPDGGRPEGDGGFDPRFN
jgi:sec-independent protein translocase protein TatB